MSDPSEALRHHHLRQQPPLPPPQATLPSIPQLPPISLASSPSIESFATAMSTTSRDRENQHRRPTIPPSDPTSTSPPALSFTPPASPSANFYPHQQRQIRAAASVQHLRTGVPYPSSSNNLDHGGSDFSDVDGANRATPVPRNRTPMPPYVSSSDHERRTDSDWHYYSTRSGTMSDHTTGGGVSVRSLSTAARTSAARLHALSTASTASSATSGSGSSLFGGGPGAVGGKSPRRSDAPQPPPPTGKPLPTPGSPGASASSSSGGGTGAGRVVNRARSASLLGMVSSVAATSVEQTQQHPMPRSAASVQNLQKPRLALHPSPSPAPNPSSPVVPEFTILVVGSPQCGKSVLISKGLKSWNLEKEKEVTLGTFTQTVQLPSGPSNINHELRAISRMAHVAIKNSTYPIETLEIASPDLFLAGPAWPAVIANGAWSNAHGSVQNGVQNGKKRTVDGLVICYDSSEAESWDAATTILEHASRAYINQPVQAIVIACKTDLLNPPVPADHTEYHPLLSRQSADADKYQIGIGLPLDAPATRGHHVRSSESDDGHGSISVPPQVVHKNLGLVPVARTEGQGKKKMRDAFGWLLKRVERARRHYRVRLAQAGSPERPPSPPPPISAVPKATPPGPSPTRTHPSPSSTVPPPSATPMSPISVLSPSNRARSTSDLNGRDAGPGSGTEREKGMPSRKGSASVSNLRSKAEGGGSGQDSRKNSGAAGNDDANRQPSMTMTLPMKPREPPPLQYATLDELLDKLVFLGVADDEPAFAQQFFLVYRRFATPRSILLGFQKRMRELSTMTDDLLLAKYAQMRMCSLLEDWMDKYPGDFAAPGAEPALHALIRQLLSLCHTAHYGSDFMSFLEVVPDLVDEERAWALKETRPSGHDTGGEDEGLVGDEAAEALRIAMPPPDQSADSLMLRASQKSSASHPQSAAASGAAPGIPHSQVTLFGEYNSSKGPRGPDVPPGTKPNMKELLKASIAITQKAPHFVAEEITRLEVPMFLSVQPRDWLRHGLGEKGHEDLPETIPRMAKFYNYLTIWTASLILVHEKARNRARTIDFFIRVALVLRKLNNYSGLRAVVMGISNSRTDRELDPVMAHIKDRRLWKDFKSLEALLSSSRMHSAYRMALRHTFDAAIPSMEIHTYDLIRADDTNTDYHRYDSSLIHWGKFVMMAKMVLSVTAYQEMFVDTTAFTFPERPDVRELIMGILVMDEDTMYSRVVMPIEAHSGGPLSDGGGAASRFRSIFARRPAGGSEYDNMQRLDGRALR